jgi:hypothetical protein
LNFKVGEDFSHNIAVLQNLICLIILGLTQINQELKFLAKSSRPLKWTEEYF